MQYMLLIYGDMSAFPEMNDAEQAAEMKRWYDYSDWLAQKGWMKAGDALVGRRAGDERAGARRGAHRDRRPVRGDEGDARRLLPARGRQPRRRDRGGRGVSRRAVRHDRAAPGHGDAGAAAGVTATTDEVVDRLFRRESGRAVATLIRTVGSFDLAEEAVQEAFAVALDRGRATASPTTRARGSPSPPATGRSIASGASRSAGRRPQARSSFGRWRTWTPTTCRRSPTNGCG